jgi:hypothetical protein
MADDLTVRMLTMEALKDYAIRTHGIKLPPIDSADALLDLARSFNTGEVEAALGIRTEPAFPGLHSVPSQLSEIHWHMICACKLYSGDRHVGNIFTTFVGGRPIGIYANAPDPQHAIPPEYKPLR